MNTFAIVLVLAQAAGASPEAPAPLPSPAATPTGAPACARPAGPRKLSGGFGLKTVPPEADGANAANGGKASTDRRGTFSIAGPKTSSSSEPQARVAEGAEKPSEETVWRGRVARLRAELGQAQKDYDRADAANTVVGWGKRGATYETLMAIRNAALTPYVTRLMETRAALDALPEECRKTQGCQPGWLR